MTSLQILERMTLSYNNCNNNYYNPLNITRLPKLEYHTDLTFDLINLVFQHDGPCESF